MVDAGLIVIVAFISPFRAERARRRARCSSAGRVRRGVRRRCRSALAEERDPKGLYEKARRGELENFTGIDSPYEPPESPELRLDMAALDVEEGAERLVETLRERGLLP